MKKYLIVALVLTMLLTACQTKKKDVLKVLVSADNPPYESIDVNGKFVGFDIEFGEELAKKLNVTIEWVDTSFEGIIGALQGNTGDMAISGMSITAEREESVDFSIAYKEESALGETFTVISLASNGYGSISDLKGKKASAQMGTVQESALNMLKSEYSLVLDIRSKFDIIVQDILLGRIDFLVIDKASGDEFLAQYPELSAFTLQHAGLTAINGMGVALPTGSVWVAKVNAVIESMKKDGSLQALIDKWWPAE